MTLPTGPTFLCGQDRIIMICREKNKGGSQRGYMKVKKRERMGEGYVGKKEALTLFTFRTVVATGFEESSLASPQRDMW